MSTNFQSIRSTQTSFRPAAERRGRERVGAVIPGRVIWKDQRGTPRFSSVVTRDLSDVGAFVECLSGPPIPMHRLVYLQLDRVPGTDQVPFALRQGKVLSAVSRVAPVSKVTGLPEGYALRLLIEPAHVAHPAAASTGESLALPA